MTPNNNTCPHKCGAKLTLTGRPVAGDRYLCPRCRRAIVVVGAAIAPDGEASVSFDALEAP